jgi:hypothetical protein
MERIIFRDQEGKESLKAEEVAGDLTFTLSTTGIYSLTYTTDDLASAVTLPENARVSLKSKHLIGFINMGLLGHKAYEETQDFYLEQVEAPDA